LNGAGGTLLTLGGLASSVVDIKLDLTNQKMQSG
jgi:hypothetical protein